MKRLLSFTLLATILLPAIAQDNVYLCKHAVANTATKSYHRYTKADLDYILTDREDSVVVFLKNKDRHAYSWTSADRLTFDKPANYEAGTAAGDDGIVYKEAFSTGIGSFSVSTIKGLGWVFDSKYKVMKASGYRSGNTTASESYLISPAADLTQATKATLTFDYMMNYTGSTHKVLITDNYTGDPSTTEWQVLVDNEQLPNPKSFKVTKNISVDLPSRYLGESNAVIAFYYTCGSKSSTWEVQNVKLSMTSSNTPDEPGSGDDTNVNKNTTMLSKGAWRLEMPHLKGGDMNLFIQKSTSLYGVTYSLEWDCTKKASRWVAFQMHDGLPDNNVGRNDGWQTDSDIPSAYQTTSSDYSGTGFSRGHMCASSDRQSSIEQNHQTFIMSNIMPQYQNHNGGQWLEMENVVQKWGYSSTYRDTLYVVKGGTIDSDANILKTTSTGLIVPKYFFMAILCYKNGQYKAVAFWTEHVNTNLASTTAPKDYAISIDELEEKTGIDFFCNLPDDIETEVEKSYNASDWTW